MLDYDYFCIITLIVQALINQEKPITLSLALLIGSGKLSLLFGSKSVEF